MKRPNKNKQSLSCIEAPLRYIKVWNMTSDYGNPIANQIIIRTNKGHFFQSYDTMIAFKDNNNRIILNRKYWNYSRTTAKYRNKFSGLNTKETKVLINSGHIKLEDWNNEQ